MAGVTVQTIFAHESALPKDSVINNLHFSPVPDAAGAAAIFGAIESFYNSNFVVGGNGIGDYLSSVIDRGAPVQMRMYDSSTSGPTGPPIFTDTFTLVPPANVNNEPAEVAAVASFYSGAASNVATGRGRIYIGPLNRECEEQLTNGQIVLSAAFRADVVAAMEFLEDATPVNPWCVRITVPTVQFLDVDGGFVDSAFDTQRRRGEDALTRTSWHV